jgi:hypothetical protein
MNIVTAVIEILRELRFLLAQHLDAAARLFSFPPAGRGA